MAAERDTYSLVSLVNPDPMVGDVWRSRDKRDDGLLVTVTGVDSSFVWIKRFRKSRVRRERFYSEYRFVQRAS